MVIGLEIRIQFSLILEKVSLIVLRLEKFEIVSCFFFFLNSHIELFSFLDTLDAILRHVKFLDSVSDRLEIEADCYNRLLPIVNGHRLARLRQRIRMLSRVDFKRRIIKDLFQL